jgi:predicted Zn-dependent protease
MGSVAGQVMACRSLVQETTRVNATVTVANSGAVTSASVSGGSSDVQQCVERAVQRARFPRFTQPTFAVTYPFVLSPEE